jgi:rubrerythrin
MNSKFTINDILDIAQQIEKNCFQFYSTCTEKIVTAGVREALKELARSEEAYSEKLKNMQDNLEPVKVTLKNGYAGDNALYLETLARESVYIDRDKACHTFKNAKDDQDIMDFAIGLESAAIKFFEYFKELVSAEVRTVAEMIIADKIKHLLLLKKCSVHVEDTSIMSFSGKTRPMLIHA